MYKLVVLDCDGTLLNPNKEITSYTIRVIKSLIDNGVRFVIASARPFYRLLPYLEKIGTNTTDQYTISFNGGFVKSNIGDEVLFSKVFTSEEISDIIAFGNKYKSTIFLYSENVLYSNHYDECYKRKNPDANFITTDFNCLDFSRIKIYKIVYYNAPTKTQKLKRKLPQSLIGNYEITSSVPQYIEFVPKGIDKAKALKLICDKLDICKKDVIAFGDENNDAPMLKFAGFSVAMGNSSETIKEIADYVTASNSEDGVAKALTLLFDIN